MENTNIKELKGNKYGIHRVITPEGVLPQAASKINNDMTLYYDNEIRVNVTALNIDSASFTQIASFCNQDEDKIKAEITNIVSEKGKMQNRVTGSGGMFIGTISHIGSALKNCELKIGDRIASLVSLSLTPLKIVKVISITKAIDRVNIKGEAVLFESGIYAKLPSDINEELALAALDVSGAPAQTARIVKPGYSCLILGGAGKAGILCCYEAKKMAGSNGLVTAVVYNEAEYRLLDSFHFCDQIVIGDASKPANLLEKVLAVNNNCEYDLSICCVNVMNCEMSAILPIKDNGIAYFFSMATSFTRCALGAEGIGKDITMIIGNGYTKGHAEFTLNDLRESLPIRKFYEEKYVLSV